MLTYGASFLFLCTQFFFLIILYSSRLLNLSVRKLEIKGEKTLAIGLVEEMERNWRQIEKKVIEWILNLFLCGPHILQTDVNERMSHDIKR